MTRGLRSARETQVEVKKMHKDSFKQWEGDRCREVGRLNPHMGRLGSRVGAQAPGFSAEAWAQRCHKPSKLRESPLRPCHLHWA